MGNSLGFVNELVGTPVVVVGLLDGIFDGFLVAPWEGSSVGDVDGHSLGENDGE